VRCEVLTAITIIIRLLLLEFDTVYVKKTTNISEETTGSVFGVEEFSSFLNLGHRDLPKIREVTIRLHGVIIFNVVYVKDGET